MACWFRLLVALVAVSSLVLGCSDSSDYSASSYKFSLPIYNLETQSWEWQFVTIDTLASITKLQGKAARIYYRPGFSADRIEGSVMYSKAVPLGNGLVTVGDPDSQLGMTLYAHMEKLYKQELAWGVHSQVRWPRTVVVDANILANGGGVMHDSAHYFGHYDAIAISREKEISIPFGVNPGVVAHEHFHSYFYNQVTKRVFEDIEKWYGVSGREISLEENPPSTQRGLKKLPEVVQLNLITLRAWNEGLADLRGEVYSGNPNFLYLSDPTSMDNRAIDRAPTAWRSNLDWSFRVGPGGISRSKVHEAYRLGSRVARLFYQLRDGKVVTAEKQMQYILAALPAFGKFVLETYRKRPITLAEPLEYFWQDTGSVQKCGLMRYLLLRAGSNPLLNVCRQVGRAQ